MAKGGTPNLAKISWSGSCCWDQKPTPQTVRCQPTMMCPSLVNCLCDSKGQLPAPCIRMETKREFSKVIRTCIANRLFANRCLQSWWNANCAFPAGAKFLTQCSRLGEHCAEIAIATLRASAVARPCAGGMEMRPSRSTNVALLNSAAACPLYCKTASVFPFSKFRRSPKPVNTRWTMCRTLRAASSSCCACAVAKGIHHQPTQVEGSESQ